MTTVSRRRLARLAVAGAALMAAASPALAQSGEVNVYTYRESKLIQPLFEAFTKDSGIRINVISASSGLEQRIKTEGSNSPADVLLTVDIGRLEDAVQAGITQPIKSDLLDKAVPPQYRDPEGHWSGISMRARVAYASKERVKQGAITYEELADPKWKGKICIRSGQHIYNNALFAAVITKHGAAKAEEWLRGLKANLAQKPSGGDRETARDVASGKCDLGIGNTDLRGRRHAREPVGGGAGQARAQQGQCNEIDRMAGRREGPAHARRPELRVSGARRHCGQSDHRRLWAAQPRPDADLQDRRAQEGGGQPGRQGRLRQLSR
jgi:hypothetical protein